MTLEHYPLSELGLRNGSMDIRYYYYHSFLLIKHFTKKIIFLYFRESDIALNIAYKFNQTTEPLSKKRKFTDAKKMGIIEYSSIKLPAQNFIDYLSNDMRSFVDQCLR